MTLLLQVQTTLQTQPQVRRIFVHDPRNTKALKRDKSPTYKQKARTPAYIEEDDIVKQKSVRSQAYLEEEESIVIREEAAEEGDIVKQKPKRRTSSYLEGDKPHIVLVEPDRVVKGELARGDRSKRAKREPTGI